MKKLSYLLSIAVLSGVLALVGCGDDDNNGPTIQEQQLAILVGNWTPTGGDAGVSLGDNNAPGDWSNLQVSFTSSNGFTVTGQPTDDPIVVLQNASFTVSGESTSEFTVTIGSDAVNVNQVSSTNIVISFNLEEGGTIGARTNNVQGNWSFNLTKSN